MANHLKRELIGSKIIVTDAANRQLIGMRGVIIDETKHTLTIRDSSFERKRLIKSAIVFELRVGGAVYSIDGKKIVARPEERIKK